jgi:hypothetical protein
MHANYSRNIETLRGIIVSPGKFEGEPEWAPYFYDAILNGCCDHDYQNGPDDGACFFVVTDADRREFPELADIYGVGLAESSQGFIYTTAYATAEAFEAVISIQQSCYDAE